MLKVNGSSIAVPASPPMPGTMPSTRPIMQPAPGTSGACGSIRIKNALPAAVAMKAISPVIASIVFRPTEIPRPSSRILPASRANWSAPPSQSVKFKIADHCSSATKPAGQPAIHCDGPCSSQRSSPSKPKTVTLVRAPKHGSQPLLFWREISRRSRHAKVVSFMTTAAYRNSWVARTMVAYQATRMDVRLRIPSIAPSFHQRIAAAGSACAD